MGCEPTLQVTLPLPCGFVHQIGPCLVKTSTKDALCDAECRVQGDRALAVLVVGVRGPRRLGARGVLILPEEPMDWEVVRVFKSSEVSILVASASQRQLDTVRRPV